MILEPLSDAIAMHAGGVAAVVVELVGAAGEASLRMTVREGGDGDRQRRLQNELGEHQPGVKATVAQRLPDVMLDLPWADADQLERSVVAAAWHAGAWDVCRLRDAERTVWTFRIGHGDPLAERRWRDGDATLNPDALRSGPPPVALRWKPLDAARTARPPPLRLRLLCAFSGHIAHIGAIFTAICVFPPPHFSLILCHFNRVRFLTIS